MSRAERKAVAVLVNYVSFEVETDDRDAFDSWYLGLIEAARNENGCIVYDYLTDPRNPTRGITIAAWQSEADIAAHRLHHTHVELMALGSAKGIRDIHVHSFGDVGKYKTSSRSRLDGAGDDPESRARMLALIAAYQAKSRMLSSGDGR